MTDLHGWRESDYHRMERTGAISRSHLAIDDMLSGYLDGFDPSSPQPGQNRSSIYRHGLANGRDDGAGKSLATPAELRETAARLPEREAAECDGEMATRLRGVAHDIRCLPLPEAGDGGDSDG